jgi:hypothetical protein
MWALSTTVLDADEPTTYAEAMTRPDANLWRAAIQAEYQSLQRAGTYTLTKLPTGRQAIGCKWVFKLFSLFLFVFLSLPSHFLALSLLPSTSP